MSTVQKTVWYSSDGDSANEMWNSLDENCAEYPYAPYFPQLNSSTPESNARNDVETVGDDWGELLSPFVGDWRSKIPMDRINTLKPPNSPWSNTISTSPEYYGSKDRIVLDPFTRADVSSLSSIVIGTVISGGRFTCPKCNDQPVFGRLADLYRHYRQVHDSEASQLHQNGLETPRISECHRSIYSSPRKKDISSYLWSTTTAMTCTVCAYAMNRYAQFQDTDHRIQPDGDQYSSLPLSLIFQPSPEIFVATAIIHGVSAHCYYGLRSEDMFRGYFVVIGMISGAMGGLLMKEKAHKILIGILPLMLIASLVICTGMNSMWKCCGYRNWPKEHERDGTDAFVSG
ncbi:unnamed protein product [Periconia digitata]|uniref:Uncharacterized protein n=1 Tax=Periconia digitata TaxID=1303443 RepID=A0A9W4US56_9PLEO|nr:unnamed protein product [Periconia digitata]